MFMDELLDLEFFVNVLYIIVCPFVLFSFNHCIVCPSVYDF